MSARPLRIGFVLDDSLDAPAGVQGYVVTLGEWLRRRGHDVTYLASTTSRHDLASIHELAGNIGVVVNGNYVRTPLPARRRAVRHALDAGRFDILHVQMPFSPLLAGRVIRSADPRTAVVGTFHVLPKARQGVWLSRLLARLTANSLRRFDAVMSVSAPAQTFAREVFGINSIVVPGTVDLERFRSAAPKVGGHSLNIVFLGRLVERKGCIQLLLALAALNDMDGVPAWHATICGDGPLAPVLHQLVRDQALEERITFAGHIAEADKPSYLAGADITVFPSLGGESFGIVLVEAMAAGHAAVLAGDNSGYRAVLETCPGEVLFNPRDTDALARKLSGLLRGSRARQHIAAWQRQYAERFDVSRVGRDVLRVYLSALRRRRDVR